MNLFDLGGQLLRVGRAVTPPGDRNLGAGGVPQAMPRSCFLISTQIKTLVVIAGGVPQASKNSCSQAMPRFFPISTEIKSLVVKLCLGSTQG